jgi:proteic killer suppression protein
MIISFKHKGLRVYFGTGDSSKLNQSHLKRLRLVLAQLHAAEEIRDMDFPGSGLHSLKGDKKSLWSVSISGNWRLIFRFEKGHAYDVDYMDYH